ncbi:MAG: hypothetical protein H0V91_01345 [Flavisolibacter sp.]|nr:hypothetical protein [Flavisolibacter sp.]
MDIKQSCCHPDVGQDLSLTVIYKNSYQTKKEKDAVPIAMQIVSRSFYKKILLYY